VKSTRETKSPVIAPFSCGQVQVSTVSDVFTTFLHDRGRFRIRRQSQEFNCMPTLLLSSRGRVTAALQAYYGVCSGSSRMCDTGRLGRELQFLRAFADLHEILQTWVQLQGRLVVWWTETHLAAFFPTTVNLMARGHTATLKTHLYVYSNDGSGRFNGCFPSSSQRKPAGQRNDRLLEGKITQLVDVSRRNSTGKSEDTARNKSRGVRYNVQLPLRTSGVPDVGPREVNTWG